MTAATTATAGIAVTAENISRARAKGVHPVSLAILDAMPGFDAVDILTDRAICWVDVSAVTLKFPEPWHGFISNPAFPFFFTAEVTS